MEDERDTIPAIPPGISPMAELLGHSLATWFVFDEGHDWRLESIAHDGLPTRVAELAPEGFEPFGMSSPFAVDDGERRTVHAIVIFRRPKASP
jgi:hypothetical protein